MRKEKKKVLTSISKIVRWDLSKSKGANSIGKLKLLRLISKKERHCIVKVKSQVIKSKRKKMKRK